MLKKTLTATTLNIYFSTSFAYTVCHLVILRIPIYAGGAMGDVFGTAVCVCVCYFPLEFIYLLIITRERNNFGIVSIFGTWESNLGPHAYKSSIQPTVYLLSSWVFISAMLFPLFKNII